jgi:hypothetical protein
MRGLDPRIHALAVAASTWGDDMDAHGTSPWAEGPRIKSGHDDFELCNDRCMLRSARIANFPGQPCAFAGVTNNLRISRGTFRVRLSVYADFSDQIMEVAVATVGDAFEPAQCLALVGMFPRQPHQILLRRRKLGAP